MELNKCKDCNQLKPKVFHRYRGKQRIFKDDTGRLWYGNRCPDCESKRHKFNREMCIGKSNSMSKECFNCKKQFITLYDNALYCSNKCRKKARCKRVNARHKHVDKIKVNKICNLCSKSFMSVNPKQKSCSIYCQRKYRMKTSIKARNQRKANNRTYMLKRRQRVPKWADKKAIEQFYLTRPEGYEVDHIIPLNGRNVCGFHVEYNLQYLTVEENNIKLDSCDGTYDNLGWKSNKS